MHFRKNLKYLRVILLVYMHFILIVRIIIVGVVPCCVALNGFLESNMYLFTISNMNTRFGGVSQFLVPPSKSMAVVKFFESTEAKAAYR